jgi:AcrR family transcriptional regulator
MARPRSADHHLKRDEILDVAASCFAQLSYPAASMQEVAARLGTSKARIYHYYESKDALLFDLLDRYTQRLLAIVGETEAQSQRKKLDDKAALHALIEAFLVEYETSATTHVALLNDTKFLSEASLHGKPSQRQVILQRQRDIVSAFTRFLRRAYPQRLTDANQTALTMMLMGMINWTFTWLRPGGVISYAQFAQEVIRMLEHGLQT